MKLLFVCIVFVSWIENLCFASPIPTTPTTVVIKPSEDGGQMRNIKTMRPKCLLSLFGLDSVEPPQVPDFNSSPYPGTGAGLQGGILSNNGYVGTGSRPGIHDSSPPGLGLPSQYTPGLGQASDAFTHAQGLESQLYGTQYKVNSQLAGVPNSGIPLSPGYLRGGPSFGLTSFAPPPTIFYK